MELQALENTVCIGAEPLFDRGPAVHVATPEDVAAHLAAAATAPAVLWDRPVVIATALAALSVSDGRVPLGASLLLAGVDGKSLAAAWAAGVRLICWSPVPGGDHRNEREGLIAASRQGIWSHLRLAGAAEAGDALTAFAAGSPNIVHSWQVGGHADAFGQVPDAHPITSGYGDVMPLPGVPLWRRLGTPGRLLTMLNRCGKDRVRRWRVDPATDALWEIGTDLAWHFLPPEALAPGVLDEICRMVAAGGSVDTRWVRHNLERAFLIAYVTEQGQIVGNSSLKHPREEYIATVRERYGLDFSRHLERGYTSVRPEYRGLGIGTRLLEGLTHRADGRKIFSIIAEDNVATQKIAIRNRTRKVATVFSEAMGKEIGFWMPEEQIDGGAVI
ncbi:MAG: GNAT family N-acetyltransferase [Pseudomonadota bacterium]